MGTKYFPLPSILACLLLTGCSLPARNPAAFTASNQPASIDPSFMPGKGILSGFDEPETAASWRTDDWVLLGVKVTQPEESNVWFVRLSTLPDKNETPPTAPPTPVTRDFTVPFGVGNVNSGVKFNAPTARVLIETFSDQGTLLRSSVRSVPQMCSNASLLDALMELQPSTAVSSTQSQDKGGTPQISRENLAGLMVMLQSMGASRALTPIRDAVRRDVVKKPSLIGMVLGGLRMRVDTEITETEAVASRWSPDAALTPRREAQFPVVLSGQKLFDCRLVVGPANPPYNLLGGVLLFEAVHPEKPDNRLTLRVLAAKRMGTAERHALPTVAGR